MHTIKENTVNIANKINTQFMIALYYVLDTVSTQSQEFYKFLLNRNIITICIGLLISVQFGKIVNTIADEILAPIINKLALTNTPKLEDYKAKILGIEFRIGLLLLNVISFILIILLVYIIYEFTQSNHTEFIHNMVENVKKYKEELIHKQSK
jgi:large-conductance mechanosensitive channel